MKSQARVSMCRALWATAWAASSTVMAPAACASASRASYGGRSPLALAPAVSANTRVRCESSRARSSACSCPCALGRRMRRVAPLRLAACCQGTRLAWCSRPLTMISSPGPMAAVRPSRPCTKPWVTRFSASVVPLVNTSSCACVAPTKRLTVSRAFSNTSVARWLRVCTPRWMLARAVVSNWRMASSTTRGIWVVAALSR